MQVVYLEANPKEQSLKLYDDRSSPLDLKTFINDEQKRKQPENKTNLTKRRTGRNKGKSI